MIWVLVSSPSWLSSNWEFSMTTVPPELVTLPLIVPEPPSVPPVTETASTVCGLQAGW